MSIVKRNINSFLNEKVLVILFVEIIFIFSMLKLVNGTLSASEFILSVGANAKFISLFLFPAYIYLNYDLFTTFPECIIIRYEKISKFYMLQMISLLIRALLFVTIHYIPVVFVSRAALVRSNMYLFRTYETDWGNTVFRNLTVYVKYYKLPLQAVGYTYIYMIFGFAFLGCLLYIISRIYSIKVIYILQIIGFIWMVVALFSEAIEGVNSLESISPNRFFVLSMLLCCKKGTIVVLVIAIIIFMIYSLNCHNIHSHFTNLKIVDK